MNGAPHITDSESLKAWLDALPQGTEAEQAEARRVATIIAWRAAMRVFPVAVPFLLSEQAHRRELTPLSLFRPLLIAGVAGTCPTPAISRAVTAAAASANAALDATKANANANAASIITANPAAAAAGAATYAGAVTAATAAAQAARAANATPAISRAATDDVWRAVAIDIGFVTKGELLHRRLLWPDRTNPLDWHWHKAAEALTEAGPEWAFWIDWYEKCLAGTPQDWEGLLTDIALIPSEDWDKGPEHIAKLIDDLRTKYATSATPYGEEMVVTAEGLFDARPLPLDDARPVDTVCASVEAAVARVLRRIADGAGTDLYRLIEDDLGWLREALNNHAKHPTLLHDEFGSVWRSLSARMDSGELPRGDRLLDHLERVLDNAQIDLRRDYPEVGRAHRSRTAARLRRAEGRTREMMEVMTPAVAELSVARLGAEMEKDARDSAESADPETRDTALYRWFSRFSRMVGIARRRTVDAADDARKVNQGIDAVCGLAEKGGDAARLIREQGPDLLGRIL
jgi:hypothetical protein